MPYSIRKQGSHYEVVNRDTGQVHAKHTTKAKAQAQVRLLEGKDHGWEPTTRRKPDKTVRLSSGQKLHIHFKGKRVNRGKAK